MPTVTRQQRSLNAQLAQRLELLNSDLYKFTPRKDVPDEFDQQAGALYSKAKVTFIRGGNGSGKTEVAAQKVARFITQIQPPPFFDTPFVVVSDTYDQVANICWKEKLRRLIPDWLIDHAPGRCQWKNKGAHHPYAIALKDWPGTPGKNWLLEFHSLDQGRRAFQGRAWGGFWFSEQFEWDVFDEALARCRDTFYDGACIAEFTPLDPDLAVGYEERMADPPRGWAEYRLNLYKNTHTSQEWRETFIEGVSEELRPTRETGELLSLAGAIYKNFNPAVHVLDDQQWRKVTGKYPPDKGCSREEFKRDTPPNVFFRRAIDWGESPEHPFVNLWAWKDGGGTWFIFDEYVEATGLVLYEDRRTEIKDRYPWPEHDSHFGMTYADPSRPLMIGEFSADGINTIAASNNVHEGIEYVRRLIQVNKLTKRPQIYILKKNCPTLIKQLRKYRWMRSQKPGAFMDRRTNPTAARMEPLKYQDDLCFPAGQMVDTPNGPTTIEMVKSGDWVHDGQGVTRVITGATATGEKPTIASTFDDGRCIISTAEHRFKSFNGGWVEAQHSLGLKVLQCPKLDQRYLEGDGVSQTIGEGLLNTSSMVGMFGLVPCMERTTRTFDAIKRWMERKGHSFFTSKYGKTHTELFPKEWIFTIRMKIRETIDWVIWNCLLLRSIEQSILMQLKRQLPMPLNGIGRPKELPGINSTARSHGRIEILGRLFVNSVERNSLQETLRAKPDFVPTNAGTMPVLHRGLITFNGLAPFARNHSLSINTGVEKLVPTDAQTLCVVGLKYAGVKQVYCLATESGEFSVNGVIVKNCDALRYLTFSDRVQAGKGAKSMGEYVPDGKYGIHIEGRYNRQ